MNWWIAADLLGAFVLVPALAVAFGGLIRTLRTIVGMLPTLVDDCAAITGELDGVSRLAETEMLTSAGLAGVTRCTEALAAAP
jgi:hypothetical protein